MCYFIYHNEDWKCNQYPWVTKVPDEAPKLIKCYYYIDTPNGSNSSFKRHGYKLNDDQRNLVLVYYIGDEEEAVAFAHRSATKLKPNFVRTLSFYLKSCKKKLQ